MSRLELLTDQVPSPAVSAENRALSRHFWNLAHTAGFKTRTTLVIT